METGGNLLNRLMPRGEKRGISKLSVRKEIAKSKNKIFKSGSFFKEMKFLIAFNCRGNAVSFVIQKVLKMGLKVKGKSVVEKI